MKLEAIFFFAFLKMATAEAPLYRNYWVIWNVGQGQWVTHVTPDECMHFDAGGEPGAFKKMRSRLISSCGLKQNRLLLSHWDMDHFLHIPFLARTLPQLCWQYRPSYGASKPSAQKIMNLKIADCNQATSAILWVPHFARSTNESSAVFSSDNILMPGDSPTFQESVWSSDTELEKIKILVLGHHGSRTSTGTHLLSKLPVLQWAVASARWVKYRHPHEQTLKRLYEKNIPVLRTEDWGHVWFEN